MKLTSFEGIVRALNEAGVRSLPGACCKRSWLSALYQGRRLCHPIDTGQCPADLCRAWGAWLQPLAPVTADQFSDRVTRESWIRDKNMQVLQFWSDSHRETSVDIFVHEPFSFDEEYANALIKPLYGSIEVRFVSTPTLIKMKEVAGREQDRIDIEHLRMRLEDDAGK